MRLSFSGFALAVLVFSACGDPSRDYVAIMKVVRGA
jgi:hypothetical protein